jgi:hypothetical protein
MSSILAVVVNDQLTLKYERDKVLPEHQQAYLEKLDAKFEQGIELDGEFVPQPVLEERARYMALSLMEGILYQEDARAAVSLAWLATRLPELKQVKAHVDQDGTRFDLVFDEEYRYSAEVSFTGLN